jgi:hypothetical protein
MYPILMWPQAGRGDYTAWPSATNTIMGLRALAHGQLVFAAQDPVFGLLDRQGRKVLGHRHRLLSIIAAADKMGSAFPTTAVLCSSDFNS